MPADARTISLPLLDRVQTASPCDVGWENMIGDDVSRHCAQCDMEVVNIASMTRAEAEAFLQARFDPDGAERGGRVCARIYRRADGTILTRDCPVGLAAVRRRIRMVAARVAAGLGLTMLLGVTVESSGVPQVRDTEPFPRLIDAVWGLTAKMGLTKPRVPSVQYGGIDGKICVQPVAPTNPPAAGGGTK